MNSNALFRAEKVGENAESDCSQTRKRKGSLPEPLLLSSRHTRSSVTKDSTLRLVKERGSVRVEGLVSGKSPGDGSSSAGSSSSLVSSSLDFSGLSSSLGLEVLDDGSLHGELDQVHGEELWRERRERKRGQFGRREERGESRRRGGRGGRERRREEEREGRKGGRKKEHATNPDDVPNPDDSDPSSRDSLDVGEAPISESGDDGRDELSETEGKHQSGRRPEGGERERAKVG